MTKTITSVVNTAANQGSSFGVKNRHNSPLKSTVHVDGRGGLPGDAGALKKTNTVANRQRCVGENELANQQGFEVRVREVMSMRNTGNVLNARVIETWINDTLSDAEHLDIPGVVLKP